jgi:hypothetical protein
VELKHRLNQRNLSIDPQVVFNMSELTMDLTGLREETLLTEGTTTVPDLVSSIPRDSRRDLSIRFVLD